MYEWVRLWVECAFVVIVTVWRLCELGCKFFMCCSQTQASSLPGSAIIMSSTWPEQRPSTRACTLRTELVRHVALKKSEGRIGEEVLVIITI